MLVKSNHSASPLIQLGPAWDREQMIGIIVCLIWPCLFLSLVLTSFSQPPSRDMGFRLGT